MVSGGRFNGGGPNIRHDVSDKVIAERASERDTGNVATLWAEVRIREVIEEDESNEEEGEDERQCSEDETQLLGLVPFPDGDVRDKDEGCYHSEQEATNLGVVVDVRQ